MTAVMPSGSELAVAAAVALVVGGATALFAALWLRRRWRRLRLLVGRLLHDLGLDVGAAGWRRVWSLRLPDRRWRSVQASRRQLLVAVSTAERAVAAAGAAGAPLGDLQSLSRRLRSSANAVDASLRIAARRSGPGAEPPGSEQAAGLVVAAARIQEAAATALAGTTRPATAALVEDAHRELVAITSTFDEADDHRFLPQSVAISVPTDAR